MARLVIGPCSQEARGLDAGPRLVERLMSMNDQITAAIVHQISREELAHVAVGKQMIFEEFGLFKQLLSKAIFSFCELLRVDPSSLAS